MMILRYLRTVRYLKPVQIYGRLWFRLYRSRPASNCNVKAGHPSRPWHETARREPTLVGPLRFNLLNREHEVLRAGDWGPPGWDGLRTYNLHYFDDLNAWRSRERREWHRALIRRWIRENPPARGAGWEPYPISLRIVNWIKWIFSGNDPHENMNRSLAVQVKYLSRRLERHLLGNHLLANAKALLFAGYYFQGVEAKAWKETGGKILEKQLREQVLPDGGHFERSPMYHSIILEDLLDCINLLNAYEDDGPGLMPSLTDKAREMLMFLSDILHPDGEIPFFNDSAFKIAPTPQELFDYAKRLGIQFNMADTKAFIGKPYFGLWALRSGDLHVIVDAGAIGPDYLPAHAHCDTLSYEMSVAGKRFVVNSGTFAYEGTQRHAFRSTAAHNTVRIDGREQHEIWADFRVARRGYPFDIRVEGIDGGCRFEAAHNGYGRLTGYPGHRRRIWLREGKMRVEDTIEGTGKHHAESFVHLHPDVDVVGVDDAEVRCVLDGEPISIRCVCDGSLQVGDSRFSPEFGMESEAKVVVLQKRSTAPFSMCYEVSVGREPSGRPHTGFRL